MSDTADAQTKPDPENTLYMDLKQGRVVIQMFPDSRRSTSSGSRRWRARVSTTTRRSIG